MYRKIQILGCLFLFLMGIQPLHGQTVKIAENGIGEIEASNNKIQLKEALEHLEKKFDVSFVYRSGLLTDLYSTTNVERSDNFGELLLSILNPNDLKYARINKTTFLVKPKKLAPAQKLQHEVTGEVTDAQSGETLPGVNVMVEGTTAGASTNAEGKYSVVAPTPTDTLIFSFVGYETKVVPINERSTINVTLSPTTIVGEEVTVVAYGEQSTETVTGSISSVNTEKITQTPTSSVGNALTGKVPGLTTIQRSGGPGSSSPEMYVRGISSLSGDRSQPLFILDGVKVDVNAIMQLTPENIESVSVLKDASSLAVYGIEGANGAVVVTTKRGRPGDMKISFNANVGVQVPFNTPDIANSYDEARMYNLAQINDGVDPENVRFSDEALEAFRTHSDPIIYPDTDWEDYLLKNQAFQSRANIRFAGGSEDVQYLISAGFLKKDGVFKTFNSRYDYNPTFNRYNIRTNLDFDITPTTHLSFTGMGRIGEDRSQLAGWDIIYRGAPYSSPGLVDGKLVQTGNRYIPGNTDNPLSNIYGQGYNLDISNTYNLHVDLRQELNAVIQGLSFSVKGAYNSSFTQQRQRRGNVPTYEPYYRTDVDASAPGDSTIVYQKNGVESQLSYNEFYSKDRSWYVEGRLHYEQDFGPHSVEGLLLYDQRRDFYPPVYNGIPRDLVSSLGRINYNYERRYLVEFSAGYNGTENFAPGRQFGFFPAASAGWIVTNEPYFPDIPVLNFLKFRASYGITGNDTGIGRFLYLPSSYNQSAGGYSFGTTNPNSAPGASEGSIGNPLVTWERARKQNYGVNIRMFSDRLKASFDYFKEVRSDILTTRNTVPAYVAAGLPAVNIGRVQNRGYEVNVNWNQNISDFYYGIGGNVSFARNKVLYMDEVPQEFEYQRKTGKRVGQPFGHIFDRFYTEEDIANIGNGVADPGYNAKPGDLKFKDMNGDGVIDGADQAPIGYTQVPEYSFGINFDVGYKNLQLRTVWAGATNVSRVLGKVPFRTGFGFRGGTSITQWQVDGHWTPEKGQNATYPRMSLDARNRRNQGSSDFWRRDATYLRLKNAELAYTVGPRVLEFMGLNALRMYVNGYNLLTFTGMDVIDPETNPVTFTAGSNNVQYPLTRVFNFGINMQF